MHRVEIVITDPEGAVLERVVMDILGVNHTVAMPIAPFQNVNTMHPNSLVIREIKESQIELKL